MFVCVCSLNKQQFNNDTEFCEFTIQVRNIRNKVETVVTCVN